MPWLSDPIKRAREIKGAWRAVGGVASARAVTLTAGGNDDRTARGNVNRSVSGRGAHASIPKMGVFIPGMDEPTGRDSVSVLTRHGNPLPDIR
jgi:hypothetical protein